MIVLVSPTKTQKRFPEESQCDSSFTESKNKILSELKTYSYDDIKTRMKVSDKIATLVKENLDNFNENNIAVKTYQGASFKPLESDLWDYNYAQEHFGILSALYGLVHPFQRIGLYRLDFMMPFKHDLYSEWQSQITEYLNNKNKTVVSLASKEYEKMIDLKSLKTNFIRLDFKENVDGKYVTKSTYAKTARGNAANQIVKNKISSVDDLKDLTFDGYTFNSEISTDNEYIFTR